MPFLLMVFLTVVCLPSWQTAPGFVTSPILERRADLAGGRAPRRGSVPVGPARPAGAGRRPRPARSRGGSI